MPQSRYVLITTDPANNNKPRIEFFTEYELALEKGRSISETFGRDAYIAQIQHIRYAKRK